MHTRKNYDEHQAASVLSHVENFINRLAEKIDENPKKQIILGTDEKELRGEGRRFATFRTVTTRKD